MYAALHASPSPSPSHPPGTPRAAAEAELKCGGGAGTALAPRAAEAAGATGAVGVAGAAGAIGAACRCDVSVCAGAGWMCACVRRGHLARRQSQG